MVERLLRSARRLTGGALAALVIMSAAAQTVSAQSAQRTVTGERYIPTIWIDPDGCEHWVMDDGAEGYMSPHVRRDGTPVCRQINLCGVINTDQLFATDSARVGPAGERRLREFFQSATAVSFGINGHTDDRASDEYNMRLSQRRAEAVARVAEASGVRVSSVRGYGERKPKASNATAEGRAQNRRVEIMCWR